MKNELVLPSLPNSSVHFGGIVVPSEAPMLCDWHLHDEFELLWVRAGSKEYTVGEKKYLLRENDMIFLGSRVPHAIIAHRGCVDFFVQFENEQYSADEEHRIARYLSRFLNSGSGDVIVFRPGDTLHAQLLPVLEQMAEERQTARKSYEIYLKAYVYQMLAILSRNGIILDPHRVFDAKKVKRLLPVLSYIDEHYREPITLDSLCALMNMNKSYFCRLFRKAANTSVIQYLNFVRVCKAERMLLSTDRSISQIAIECGFSSVAYFNRVFKKYRFCTPSFYKKIKN